MMPIKMKARGFFINDDGFCPYCGIGLNNSEINLCFCQNCRGSWRDEDDEDGQWDDQYYDEDED